MPDNCGRVHSYTRRLLLRDAGPADKLRGPNGLSQQRRMKFIDKFFKA
jgi:hypothetical protein